MFLSFIPKKYIILCVFLFYHAFLREIALILILYINLFIIYEYIIPDGKTGL